MSAKLMLIHCQSPLHAGTGQGVGAVDLPIARESSTGLPYLPGSSIKGSLRDKASHAVESDTRIKLFGPEHGDASAHAGALSFGDAQLVSLPVRSVFGTFAQITSPLLLQRLFRDAREAGLTPPVELKDLLVNDYGKIKVSKKGSLLSNEATERVYLEDLDLKVSASASVQTLAKWLGKLLFSDDPGSQDMMVGRLAVVHDDVLAFLSRHAIDIVTRASIDAKTKTVKPGQLWTEENLPSESILASLVADIPVLAKRIEGGAFEQLEKITQGSTQFGGHATIGRGRARVVLQGGK
jgi:CRISPR-associated protein Cmr4